MKKITLVALILLFAVSSSAFAAPKESTLEADELNYNVQTKAATAIGHVVYTRGTDVKDIIKGDRAEGFIDKYVILTGNPVAAVSDTYKARLTAKKIVWTNDKTEKTNGCYEAFGNVRAKRSNGDSLQASYVKVCPEKTNGYYEASGNVRAKRGNGDFLNAAYVKIYPDANIYDATGNVEAEYEKKYVKASDVHRNGANFSGKNIVKLEDKIKKYSISAALITGKINEKNEITDAVADKNVVFNNTDKNGLQSRLYGDHAVYSKSNGTLTVTGNARGVRSDGKKISADKLVYHENTEQIEAIGKTKIIFIDNK